MIQREDEKLEQQLLSIVLRSSVHAEQASQIVTPNFFSYRVFRRVYSLVVKVFERYRTVVDKEMFAKALGAAKVKEEEKFRLQAMFESLKSLDVDQKKFQFLVDQLKDMAIARSLHDTAVHLVEKLNRSDDSAVDVLKEIETRLYKARQTSGLSVIDRGFMRDTVEMRKIEYQERKEKGEIVGIPFGIQKLDELTSGHFPGELSLWFAKTGAGKSTILHTVAFHAFVQGFNGMLVTLEMPRSQVERKFDARQARVDSSKIRKGQMSEEEEEKWLQILEVQKNQNFYLVDIPRGCNVPMIEAEIDLYQRMYGKLDFVVIDYLTLMQPTEKFFNSADKYGSIARELKELARLKHVSILTATQKVREGDDPVGPAEVTTDHIALSNQIPSQCDFIGYLHQSREDSLKNLIKHVIVKFREGANVQLTHYVDFPRSYIGDDVWKLPKVVKLLPGRRKH